MKLTYRILKRDNGRVVFKNLRPEDIDAVGRLLEGFGFSQDTEDTWADFVDPSQFEADESTLDQIARYVPIHVHSTLSLRGNAKFYVAFDLAEEASGSDLPAAMLRAHKKWNRDNRPVQGYYLPNQLERLVNKINARRGH